MVKVASRLYDEEICVSLTYKARTCRLFYDDDDDDDDDQSKGAEREVEVSVITTAKPPRTSTSTFVIGPETKRIRVTHVTMYPWEQITTIHAVDMNMLW